LKRSLEVSLQKQGNICHYGPLQDETVFNQVEINPELHTLMWPNGADFDPETLHDWPKYAEEMQRMARQWATMKVKVA
jgi:hypothetical protein